MATSIERLTDRQVKTAKKSLNDGGNLWLLKRKDSKLWAFRLTIKGRVRKAGLGGYPFPWLKLEKQLYLTVN